MSVLITFCGVTVNGRLCFLLFPPTIQQDRTDHDDDECESTKGGSNDCSDGVS